MFDDDDRNLERGKWVPATHGFDEKGRNNQTTVMNFIDELVLIFYDITNANTHNAKAMDFEKLHHKYMRPKLTT